MKIFKKKDAGTNHSADKAAGWIAAGIHRVQSLWAKGMGRLFNRLNPTTKKVVLIICCLFMVTYCTALVAFSFGKTMHLLKMPAGIGKPLKIVKPFTDKPPVMPAFIRRIEKFKHYLDSLSTSADGRRIRDSLLKERPGVLDSIKKIESIYCPN
jgi:hypothetical protein